MKLKTRNYTGPMTNETKNKSPLQNNMLKPLKRAFVQACDEINAIFRKKARKKSQVDSNLDLCLYTVKYRSVC